MAPLIAIVGSDGSGKSTVGQALLEWMGEQRPAMLCHLGKQSGNLGRAIGRMPMIGRRMDRTIQKTVKDAGSRKGPSPIAALAIYAFSLRRLRRFRRMLAMRRQGIAILADRFPQLDVPDGLDGPGFGKVRHDRGIARTLAVREQKHFEWMTAHAPDLVIRLHVDVETAMLRKPDHDPAALAKKIARISDLRFGGTVPIVDIDTSQPLAIVVAEAKAAVAAMLERQPA
ncbi:nucleoside/nucleotide kinase family protein [Sphingomonas abietis]|uniref:Nucleoside triphosphate hydrolase n=1 Tax=Sphingomonas abietis TaxID=3012344 RepID=A0ABY7NHS0_9SPHN|nr:nucleoside triphosphate hydrolase [Sphingomonas abietis]WBO21034.1 nucleoside triphosphate hydrolase [Sphingomonas abietis]